MLLSLPLCTLLLPCHYLQILLIVAEVAKTFRDSSLFWTCCFFIHFHPKNIAVTLWMKCVWEELQTLITKTSLFTTTTYQTTINCPLVAKEQSIRLSWWNFAELIEFSRTISWPLTVKTNCCEIFSWICINSTKCHCCRRVCPIIYEENFDLTSVGTCTCCLILSTSGSSSRKLEQLLCSKLMLKSFFTQNSN